MRNDNNGIHVGDLVVNVSDRSVVGEVLETTDAVGGLHPASSIDVLDIGEGPRFSDSGKVPVRWNTDTPYEWWEDSEYIEVVRTQPSLSRGPLAVH